MITYHVRSRDLVNIINDINGGRLILSPYFQRNLVWRDVHKRDFIDTILRGYPFPQIFIAQGDIDVDTLESKSNVVDGQQRLNAIREFINGDLIVNGISFNDLEEKKEEFLRYQVPVIDLDIKAGDPVIIEIFKRLNRTFYALSSIERMSTEYATVDLMLLAKYACGLLDRSEAEDETMSDGEAIELHPLMPDGFIPWAESFEMSEFRKWLLRSAIFTEFEIARLVHLMFSLNIMATAYSGFFPRNDKTREYLEQAHLEFPSRDEILLGIEQAATIINRLELDRSSMWFSKSNAFSLLIVFLWHGRSLERRDPEDLRRRLEEFEENTPEDYALAAREAVNNRKQRKIRHDYITEVLGLPNEERKLQR